MQIKEPENSKHFSWTKHAINKMRQYALSEARINRVLRFPDRTEKGIAPNTIAVMQRTHSKHPKEIWVMYQTISKLKSQNFKLKIISAWRYPGTSPLGEKIPIPDDICQEIEQYLGKKKSR